MKVRIAACSALLLAAPGVIAAPGQVQVAFKIESEKFVSGLQAQVTDVEKTVAGHLAAQLQAPFPLIEWLNATPADAPAAVLTARLVQEGASVPLIQIVWSARVGDKDFTMPEIDPIKLYGPNKLIRPYRDADRLATDVQNALTAWIRTDTVERSVHDQFVTQVPLAVSVEFDTPRQAIVIPLLWERAKVRDDSVFLLEFTRPAPTERVVVRLTPPAPRLGDPPGATECAADACTEGVVSVAKDAVWSKCVQLLLGAERPPLIVTVREYKQDPHAGGVRNGTTVSP